MIYLDNNDSTQLHPEVLDAMLPYLKENYANPVSLHDMGLAVETGIDQAREQLAEGIGAQPKNIVFTSSATESNNLAIFGAARARSDRKHIIVSRIEHASVTNVVNRLAKEGWRVTKLDVDGQGFVDPQALRDAIDDQTCLVSIIHGNHEIGVMQDIKTLAEIAHEKDAWFHTDAAQIIGKEMFDVEDLGVDLASFNAHKCHGPKGVGALYMRRKIRPKRLMEGAMQENDMRPGTENVPGIIGFGKAVEIANRDLDATKAHIQPLLERLAIGLAEIPDTLLNGPPPTERMLGNLNVTFLYIEGEAILMLLSNRGVCVSSGSACSSKTLVPSVVLTAIGLIHEEAHGAIRYSLSRYNTAEEIDETIKITCEVVEQLREMTAFVPELHSERKGGHSFYRLR